MARAIHDDPRPGALQRFVQEHLRVFFNSLGALVNQPGNALFTALVIGIALALPASLQLLASNFQRLTYSWQGSLQMSLFLKDEVGEEQGRALAATLARRSGVKSTQYLSREQSAAEFREFSGFGEALDLLDRNPLPAVIVLVPAAGSSAEKARSLVQQLGALPEVELAQMDQHWLERLEAILAILERLGVVVAALLALAVLVIVGNTLRLDIEARRDEIVCMKLLGAPDRFVRRPFLYSGCWLGLLGSWVALLLLTLGLAVLDPPARELAALYGSDFRLDGPSALNVLLVVGGGVLLGWLGAWWTVSRHLARIQPA
jgi:cell division transport system permease protein